MYVSCAAIVRAAAKGQRNCGLTERGLRCPVPDDPRGGEEPVAIEIEIRRRVHDEGTRR
jgi:hypothetical protein